MSSHLDVLQGRIVIITGGSRGLGASMSKAFAAAGAIPVIVSRRFEQCQRLADEIKREFGIDAVPVKCNVGDWTEVSSAIDEIYTHVSQVDVLINNAGSSPLYPDLSSVTEDLWDKVFAVNLKGPFRFAQLIGARMLESGSGCIVNVSSNSAVRPLSFSIPYSAAKAGVENMTVALAHLLGPTVRVNCIRPGMFLTDVSKHWDPEVTNQQAASFAVERPGQPDEIAGAALYLAGASATYTTGAVLAVDGGIP
jgi:NAD(P)-dependent dehydrogenase (short-subunit alcohol dehydrogenase family)